MRAQARARAVLASAAAPLGSITEFPLGAGTAPYGITAGADGNVWFAYAATPSGIGRITPTGTITEFTAGLNAGSAPNGIALGPDGNVWFADRGTTKAIGRITPTGVITEYPTGAGTSPGEIAPGPDGNYRVARVRGGRRVGGRCAAPTRTNRRRKPCTRLVAVSGSFTRSARSGRNSFRFTGRIGGRKLAPGSYQLRASPRAGGRNGATVRASFRIVRRTPSPTSR